MGVVNAGSSPAPALQDSLTGKTSAVLFLQILVVGLLNFWCGGVTAAPQPFTNECWQDYIEGNFIVLRARGFKSCQSLVVCLGECRQDYIGMSFDGMLFGVLITRLKHPVFISRPSGECRQDYNLSRYLSCHYWLPLYFKEKNHG
jgi:hypothetical protein